MGENGTNMENNNPTGSIPKLRFPGFTGEWVERQLKNSFDERTEKNRCELPLLSLGEKGLVYQSDTARKDNSNADKSKYLRVAIGDIAYNTMRMWQGRCVCAEIEGIVSPAYTVCKPKNGIDSMFHYYLFKTNRMIQLFHQNSQGLVNDTLNLKYEAFSKIRYLLPPTLSEQQKIASCLSELDNLITAQGQKVDALKEKKKGMMQRMFPQKGETVPRLRFPGFEGEWGYVNGGELFMPISNKEHNSDLPILALTQDQGAVPRDEINYNVVVSDKSVANYKVVEIDDFIISLRSFQGGIEYSRYKGLCSPAYLVLRKKSKKLSSDFYRIYFKSFNYIQKLNKNLEGIRDGKMIRYKQFAEIKLPKPTLKEQQKIAEFLSELDKTIKAETMKLEALKNHKRGLMQQLFPQPVK